MQFEFLDYRDYPSLPASELTTSAATLSIVIMQKGIFVHQLPTFSSA